MGHIVYQMIHVACNGSKREIGSYPQDMSECGGRVSRRSLKFRFLMFQIREPRTCWYDQLRGERIECRGSLAATSLDKN
ncbi:hypothetical protein J6590_006797 [Homalodisca vitripennis]|nr:hypothetical protein J6590_006797 [Homalodisca vitripennis]